MFCSVSLTNLFLVIVICLRQIQLSLSNRAATFLGKGYQLCLTSVRFMTVKLYLSGFPFDIDNSM